VLDGVSRNIEARIKKKHQDNDKAPITMEDILGSLKDFMKDMAAKYAVLDRPPTLPSDTKSQASAKPEDLKKQESAP
jgi:hypothetical protein